METRISRKFEELKKADRKALIPFFNAIAALF